MLMCKGGERSSAHLVMSVAPHLVLVQWLKKDLAMHS